MHERDGDVEWKGVRWESESNEKVEEGTWRGN